ncbi:MAG: response regulator [Acidobacteria bacterium]|nr:response regulator [Acidobacteriota bacterium]
MNAKILLVMPPQRQFPLLRVLRENGLEVSTVGSFQEAQQVLWGSASYDLIFVDSELPDGSWEELLEFLKNSPRASEVIVCSRCGDEHLWAEVIQRGAFDLLPAPYEEREIARVVQSALESHYLERFARPAPARARAS